MGKVSKIGIFTFFVLLFTVCSYGIQRRSPYEPSDYTAIHLLHQGSMFKAKKEYLTAKQYYEKALLLARNIPLKKELDTALQYVNKYIEGKGVYQW